MLQQTPEGLLLMWLLITARLETESRWELKARIITGLTHVLYRLNLITFVYEEEGNQAVA